MDEGGVSPCVELGSKKGFHDENAKIVSKTSQAEGCTSREEISTATGNVNSITPIEPSGRADVGEAFPADCTRQGDPSVPVGSSGGSLAEERDVNENDEDDDDIVVTRRKLGSEREVVDEELTTGRPRRRGLLRRKATEISGDENVVANLDAGEGGSDSGGTPNREGAAMGDVPEDGDEYWDEEDELAKFISSRKDEAESPRGNGEGKTEGATSDADDDDEMNENLIEEDLEDDDKCQPEARLADPGDKLGGDWTPEVKPMDGLLQKIQQRHQQTVLKAKELLDQREEKRREKVRADFEKISKVLAEEDIEWNSEDECNQVEIVPEETNVRTAERKGSKHSYESIDGGDSDFDLDGFDFNHSEDASEGNKVSEAFDEYEDACDGEEVEVSLREDGTSIEEGRPCDSIASEHDREGGSPPKADTCEREASSSMLVDGPPLENDETVETPPDESMAGDVLSLDEDQGSPDLKDSCIDPEGGESPCLEDDDVSARVGPSNGGSQSLGDSDTGEPRLSAGDGKNLKRKHPESKGKSAFVEHEAEMSDDEGHTDDEIEDGMDEELAEFLRGEKDIVEDPRKQDDAHKKWEAQNDMKAIRDVVRGIRGGWRQKRRKKNHQALDDDDDGSIDGARRRRVANVSESDSDQENEIRHGNRNADSSDDDSVGGGSRREAHEMGEEELVDDLIAGLDVFELVGGSENGKGEKKISKAVDDLMETLVSSDMADMVDLTDMETQPHNPPAGLSNLNSMTPFARKRSKGGHSNTDHSRTVENLLTAQRGSVWDMEDGGACSVAPRQQQRNKTQQMLATPSKERKKEEGSILLSILEGKKD